MADVDLRHKWCGLKLRGGKGFVNCVSTVNAHCRFLHLALCSRLSGRTRGGIQSKGDAPAVTPGQALRFLRTLRTRSLPSRGLSHSLTLSISKRSGERCGSPIVLMVPIGAEMARWQGVTPERIFRIDSYT